MKINTAFAKNMQFLEISFESQENGAFAFCRIDIAEMLGVGVKNYTSMAPWIWAVGSLISSVLFKSWIIWIIVSSLFFDKSELEWVE